MRLSNKHGLPEAFLEAINNDSRDVGNSDFTASQLPDSPRVSVLTKRHGHEIEEDVTERIWALLGQATHSILERANKSDIAEKRYFAKFGKYIVSGQIDTLSVKGGILSDYKITSVYSAKKGAPPKYTWVGQLNIQAEILRQNGFEINKTQIIAICRDWRPGEKQKDAYGTYPETQVAIIDIPLWSSEAAKNYIEGRINAFVNAEASLPQCSSEERWQTEETYAVMKTGRKNAVKLFKTKAEALAMVEHDRGLYLQIRPGESRRCSGYCSVSEYCTQYQNELKQTAEISEVG